MLVIGFFVVSAICYIYSVKSITGIFLYSFVFGIVVFRYFSHFKPLLYFTLINGITQNFVWYFAEVYKSWTTITLLPKVLGQLTVPEILFAFFWPLAVIYVYKVFLRKNTEKIKFPNKSFVIANVAIIIILVISHFSGAITYFKYSYLYIGGVCYLVIIGLAFWKKIFNKNFSYKNLFWIGILFFIFSIVWELVGLNINWWVFNGNYLGFAKLFNVNVPYEELFMWIVLGAPMMVIFYEASKS